MKREQSSMRLRMNALIALLLASIWLRVAPAWSQDAQPAATPAKPAVAPDSKQEGETYRTQVALAYAIPVGILWSSIGAGYATGNLSIGLIGVFEYPASYLAPPIVHWAHGSVGNGFESFAGNLVTSGLGLVPGLFLGLKVCAHQRDPDDHCAGLLVLSSLTLFQAAFAVYDVAVLAREPPPKQQQRRAIVWSPVVSAQPWGSWTVGVAGAF